MERGIAARAVEPEQRQPLFGQLPLTIRHRLINAVESKNPDSTTLRTLVLTIVQMQAAADVADMALDLPDGFATCAAAEQRQIVAVALRMIAGDQTE